MKHIVCYSGGHSSALVAIEVVRKFGKDDVVLLNHYGADALARGLLARELDMSGRLYPVIVDLEITREGGE